MLAVLDTVLDDLAEQIAAYPPERGGALLGVIGRPLVTRFLYDPDARTSGVTYCPSQVLAERVQQLEREGLEFKGIVHSHPGGLDRPSAQDEVEIERGLTLNPHMPTYIAPILSWGERNWPDAPHELAVGNGLLSFYAGIRRRGCGALVRPLPVRAIPLEADLERLRQHYGGESRAHIFLSDLCGESRLCGQVELPGGLTLLLLVGESYPAEPPILLLTNAEGVTEQVDLAWRLETAAEERLSKAVAHRLEAPAYGRRAYGPVGGPAYTEDPGRALLAGWEPRYTDRDPRECAREVRAGLFARSAGILSDLLSERRALIAGLGSVGSYMAEQLVRSGVGAVTLIDPERVEPTNLSRTVYDLSNLGAPKTEALARRLLNIDPMLEVALHTQELCGLQPERLEEMVREADIVIAATDDVRAQQRLNHFAYRYGRPALFIGLYAGAKGGEVICSVPERTACYLCAARMRCQAEELAGRVSRENDYGTGRLAGEAALGVDIQHVAAAAAKIALSLLLPEGSQASLRGFLEPQLAAGATYLTLSMAPDYWFYPQIFTDTAGQFAYQAVWMTPERWEECAVCGQVDWRTNPLSVPLRAPAMHTTEGEEHVESEVE